MNGFINLIKPSGFTASDMVVKTRRILGQKKVGHLGTLDPLATGVLPIAVGKGTKLFNLLLDKKKTYRAFFTFGLSTDTLDSAGKITKSDGIVPSAELLEKLCRQMIGKQAQTPPAYSAKNVNGTRAYALARKGEEVLLPAKEIEVFGIELLRQFSPDTFEFEIVCSSGTYIRSIARDLAEKAGACAYMSALIRTAGGMFDIKDAITLDELQQLKESALIPVENAIADLPRYEFDERFYKKLDNGVKIPFEKSGYHSVYCRGELFGVGKSLDGKLDLEFYLK